jgi:hypothetical protein
MLRPADVSQSETSREIMRGVTGEEGVSAVAILKKPWVNLTRES